MIINGRIWKYGDDISTDLLFPGKYIYTVTDPMETAKHALEGLDPDFSANVQKNDIIVAGKNFGCGSSREQAATCLKYSEVGTVIAKSFGRIFFRNAINSGLLLIQCRAAVDAMNHNESASIDFNKGRIKCGAGDFQFEPLPDFILEILNSGGLIPLTKKRLQTIRS